jgi:molybdopterin converting factor small subunit
MAVRVRLFAALRDAAGTAEEQLDAGPLTDLLEELCDRHGDVFRRRLAISTVLIDGSACSDPAGVEVADGAEVALLPPVSGGTR